MQCLIFEVENHAEIEPMAYPNDLQKVHTKIDKLAARVDGIANQLAPKKERAPLVISILSLVASVFALPIMLVSWIEPHLENDQKNNITLEVTKQLAEPTRQIGEINKHVAATDASLDELKPFIHDVIDHQFQSASALSSQALGKRLPALGNLFAVATKQNVTTNPQVYDEIKKKVLEIEPSANGYWGAAAELVSYQSQMTSGWKQLDLPLCTDEPVQFKVHSMSTKGSIATIQHGPVEFHSCKIILDSPQATRLLSLGLSVADVVLDHCVIFYNGGPVLLVKQKVTQDLPPFLTGNIYFKDCLFKFSLTGAPPPFGQRLTRNLLVAKDNTVKFPVKESSGM